MARTLRSAQLETRTARLKLPHAKEPYWLKMGKGLFLGYYRGQAGTWLARLHQGGTKYLRETIARADDHIAADGAETLDFFQAQRRVQQLVDQQSTAAKAGASIDYTVADAVRDYLAAKAIEKGETSSSYQQMKNNADAHVLPRWGATRIMDLSTPELKAWQQKLATTPRRLRTRRGKPQRYAMADLKDPGTLRARKSTANRILNGFRAVLNFAWLEGKVPSDDAWRRVKPFRKVNKATVRFLSDDEVTRLMNAVQTPFRELVHAALLTGARWGGLAAMRVEAYDPMTRKVRVTEKGTKTRHIPLNAEGAAFFDCLTLGRERDALMFVKDTGGQWKHNHQSRPMLEACAAAKISPAINFHILRHTYASRLARAGGKVTLQVLAELLGHADTRVTEKHYAHLIPDHVSDVVNENMPPVAPAPQTNVQPLRRKVRKAA